MVKIRHDDKEVILLVCSPDGKFAWLEDASWTPFVDLKWYVTDARHSCGAFTLDLSMARKKEEVSHIFPALLREREEFEVSRRTALAGALLLPTGPDNLAVREMSCSKHLVANQALRRSTVLFYPSEGRHESTPPPPLLADLSADRPQAKARLSCPTVRQIQLTISLGI